MFVHCVVFEELQVLTALHSAVSPIILWHVLAIEYHIPLQYSPACVSAQAPAGFLDILGGGIIMRASLTSVGTTSYLAIWDCRLVSREY